MADPIVLLENVHLSLGQGSSRVHILRGVSLDLAEGESLGLVGPSGSGKSTLLMVMAGLERPDSGAVRVAGQDFGALDEDRLARFRGRAIGIVFQSFHLLPNMTALENVAAPLEIAGRPDAFDRAAAELAAVGLSHRLTHYPAELSGGEQQRVAIARALGVEPRLLLADEPTGNLDETTGRHIADLLFEAQRRRSMSLVLVTHDRRLATRCGRVLHVRSGQVEAPSAHRPEALTA